MANVASTPFPFDHCISIPNRQIFTSNHNQDNWLDKKLGALMIVAILIATVAFQAGVNPPSGVWQETADGPRAGLSVLAKENLNGYTRFYVINTVSFISSLSIILLLMSGLPIRCRFFVWVLMVTTWIAITAMALTHIQAIIDLTPPVEQIPVLYVLGYAAAAWMVLLALLLVAHMIRMIIWIVKKYSRALMRPTVARPRLPTR